MASSQPTVVDYLTPIRELSLAVKIPQYRQDLSIDTLSTILSSHIHHLRHPRAPFGTPNPTSKTAVESGKAIFPGSKTKQNTPGVEITADDGEKVFAKEISEKLEIDEVEALVLFKKFRNDEEALMDNDQSGPSASAGGMDVLTLSRSTLHRSKASLKKSKNKQENTSVMDSITRYYFQENLAVCELLTALMKVQSKAEEMTLELLDEGLDSRSQQIGKLAKKMLDEIIDGKPADFIQTLFMEFAKAAQTPVATTSNSEMIKLWAIHHLQIQASILESLFIFIFWSFSEVPADIAAGLVDGILGSSFGWQQVNLRLLEKLPRNQVTHYLEKIEGLLGLIAIEVLGLADLLNHKLSNIDLQDETIENLKDQDLHFLQSRSHIHQIHDTLSSSAPEVQQRKMFSVLLLAWAYILSRLPENLNVSPPADGEMEPYQSVAAVALAPSLQLFEKWKIILDGPLMQANWLEQAEDETAPYYKESFSGLLLSLPSLIRLDYISDQEGLNGVVCSLYGSGSTSTVAPLCDSFWTTSLEDPSTSDILDLPLFPYHPTMLLDTLQALTGAGTLSPQAIDDLSGAAIDATRNVFDHFSALDTLVVQLPPIDLSEHFDRKIREDTGAVIRENRQPIILPGGIVIPAGTPGVEISKSEAKLPILKWYIDVSGWTLLASLLESSIGIHPVSSRNHSVHVSDLPNGLAFSWQDIGLQGDSMAILKSGLGFIESIFRGDPELVPIVLKAMYGNDAPEQSFLRLVFASIHSARSVPGHSPVVGLAVSILSTLIHHFPGRIWIALRENNFFIDRRSGQPGWAVDVIEQESQLGQYLVTIAILQLVKRLAEQIEGARYTSAPQAAKIQGHILRDIILVLHVKVWTTYQSWRYDHLIDRTRIGRELASIYVTLVRNAHAEASVLMRQDLATAALLDKLVVSPAGSDLSPILDSIAQSHHQIPFLRRNGRHEEAEAAENLLQNNLSLVYHLLLLGSAISQLLWQKTREGDHPIELLFSYITSPAFSESTAKTAAIVLQALVTLTPTENQGSLLGALRQPELTAQMVQGILADPASTLVLQREIWRLLKAASASQPGLVNLMITGKSTPTSSGDEMTALDTAKSMITAYDEIWQTDPETLAVVMDFLLAIWDNFPDTSELKENTGDLDFWTAIKKLGQQGQPGAALAEDESAVQQYCYRRMARACALRILANVIGTSVKSGLELLSDAAALKTIVGEAMHNSCDPELQQSLNESLEATFGDGVWQDVTTREPSDFRRYGSNFVYDLENLCSTVFANVSPELEEQLILSNLNYSTMAADVRFFKAVESLIDQQELTVDRKLAISALSAAVQAIDEVAGEARQGPITQSIQNGRYKVIRDLMEMGWTSKEHVPTAIVVSFAAVTRLLAHESLSPFDWFRNPTTSLPIHRQLYPIALYALQIIDSSIERLDQQDVFRVQPVYQQCATHFVQALSLLLNFPDWSAEDGDIIVAILGILFNSSSQTAVTAAFSLIDQYGLVGRSRDVLIRSDSEKQTSIMLSFHSILARHPAGAERLAVGGAPDAYSAMSVFELATRGQADGHWSSVLDIMCKILNSLPIKSHFAASECLPLVRSTMAQFAADLQLSIGDLEFVDQLSVASKSLNLIYDLLDVPDVPPLQVQDALKGLGRPLLTLLETITFVLQSPLSLEETVHQITSGEYDVETIRLATTQKLLRLTEMAIHIFNTSKRSVALLQRDADAWAVSSSLILDTVSSASGNTSLPTPPD